MASRQPAPRSAPGRKRPHRRWGYRPGPQGRRVPCRFARAHPRKRPRRARSRHAPTPRGTPRRQPHDRQATRSPASAAIGFPKRWTEVPSQAYTRRTWAQVLAGGVGVAPAPAPNAPRATASLPPRPHPKVRSCCERNHQWAHSDVKRWPAVHDDRPPTWHAEPAVRRPRLPECASRGERARAGRFPGCRVPQGPRRARSPPPPASRWTGRSCRRSLRPRSASGRYRS